MTETKKVTGAAAPIETETSIPQLVPEVVRKLVQRPGSGLVQWTIPDDKYGSEIAYGWSDGSVTWHQVGR